MKSDSRQKVASTARVSLALKDRALAATAEGITIADARLPDMPLIYANAGFERLTGYPVADVIGSNCRFLQGPETDRRTVDAIRVAIQQARECTVEILNYRKSGERFWNRLSITPVRNQQGETTHFIGVQSDITHRKRAEEELRAANEKLQEAYGLIKKDLDAAARIQQALLPVALPNIEGFRFGWAFEPCVELAGDFLNVLRFDESHFGVYVLDVSGHGVQAALLSVTLSRWLSVIPGQSQLIKQDASRRHLLTPPAELAERLHRLMSLDTQTNQYFTILYGILSLETREFSYVSAGHPGPLHQGGDGRITMHESTGPPVGLIDDPTYEERRIRLEPGDRLWLYTDGLVEARDPSGREFGDGAFVDVLKRQRTVSIDQAVKGMTDSVHQWQKGRPAHDDLSILGIQVLD